MHALTNLVPRSTLIRQATTASFSVDDLGTTRPRLQLDLPCHTTWPCNTGALRASPHCHSTSAQRAIPTTLLLTLVFNYTCSNPAFAHSGYSHKLTNDQTIEGQEKREHLRSAASWLRTQFGTALPPRWAQYWSVLEDQRHLLAPHSLFNKKF